MYIQLFNYQFFLHDPRPNDGDSDEKDESKIWFQGRFFPSLGLKATSPTSVAASSSTTTTTTTTMDNSWGLLATQNVVVDECLMCSEGGYRELDLTFIRTKKQSSTHSSSAWLSSSSSSSYNNKKKGKKVRWVEQDVVWTGGNMMMLSSDPYTQSLPLSDHEPGVKFQTHNYSRVQRQWK